MARDRAPDVERSEVDMVRGALTGSLFWGSMLVGYGSRQRYRGVSSTVEVEAIRYPADRFGFEVLGKVSTVTLGGWASGGDGIYGGIDAAAVVAPIRVPRRASITLGLGAGFDAGDRYWFSEARGYPLALARGTWLPSAKMAFDATWRLLPLSSGALSAFENRLELAMGIGLFQFGARMGLLRVAGGEPERAFWETEAGLFVAAAGR